MVVVSEAEPTYTEGVLARRIANNFLSVRGEAYRSAPYKNFAWNLKRGHRRSTTRRDNSEILAGLDRMRY
jgi:hypothetical protein